MKNLKRQKGITLVALVVTIVILLLLAGISLSLVLGNQGLITKANEGRTNYTNASIAEQELLNTLDSNVDDYIVGKEKNSCGFYYEAPYSATMSGKVYTIILHDDGSSSNYIDGVAQGGAEEGTFGYTTPGQITAMTLSCTIKNNGRTITVPKQLVGAMTPESPTEDVDFIY